MPSVSRRVQRQKLSDLAAEEVKRWIMAAAPSALVELYKPVLSRSTPRTACIRARLGGLKESGFGLEMGQQAIHQLMRTKGLWTEESWQSPWRDVT
jgi:hypothetical protein